MRLALWGTFDLEDFGLLLTPRIFRHELERRLPGAEIRTFSPCGYQRPTRWDGGEPAEPFSAAGTDGFDCVVVDPNLLRPHGELAADYGGDLPEFALPPDVVIAPPDYARLAARVFPADVQAKRLEYLRLMGWYPRDGEVVVAQGSRADLPAVDEVAESLRGRTVVVVELAPYRGDGEFADALVAALAPEAVYRMPAAVSHEDVVAAISAAASFVGTSSHAQLVFEAYRRPQPERVAALEAQFDEVAEVALASAAKRDGRPAESSPATEYVAALRRAHDARGQRLATERAVFADHVADLRRALDTASASAVAAQQQATDDAMGRRVAEADLQALRATRTFRWSQKPRAAYEWFRQWRGGV